MSQTSGNASGATYVLVPGAWMGAWIWDDTAARLSDAGYGVESLTLRGLEADADPAARSAVTLADHVDDVLGVVDRVGPGRVILVGHSYSGMVVGQAADRRPEVVVGSVHVGSFLPRDGRSLLDDWGDDLDARSAEQQQVRDDGLLWAAPLAGMLDNEPDLTARQRAWLVERFVPHPGLTVLDPAVMSRPVTEQPVIFVADTAHELPSELRGDQPSEWRLEVIGGGHWPMMTRADDVYALLVDAAQRLTE